MTDANPTPGAATPKQSEPTDDRIVEGIVVDRVAWDRCQQRLADLEALVTELTTPTTPDPEAPGERHDRLPTRRHLLLGAASAAIGTTAVALANAAPAAANTQGQSLTIGDATNTASSTTGLTASISNAPTVEIVNLATTGPGRTGVRARSGFTSGINLGSAAIVGDSETRPGIIGTSADDAGIWGYSTRFDGVQGTSEGAGVGVSGASGQGHGVAGRSFASGRAGVTGHNDLGYGLSGSGRRPLRLVPAATTGRPSGTALAGETFVDATGALFVCVATNRWRTVAGPTTAGALHVLAAPVRAYDSRPGTSPAVGTKAPLAPGAVRTLSMAANGTGVPTDATSVLLTILLVDAQAGDGNLTVWAAGVAKPSANTLVWGGSAGRFTTSATTALGPSAQVQVSASRTTHVVIDVVGYYR